MTIPVVGKKYKSIKPKFRYQEDRPSLEYEKVFTVIFVGNKSVVARDEGGEEYMWYFTYFQRGFEPVSTIMKAETTYCLVLWDEKKKSPRISVYYVGTNKEGLISLAERDKYLVLDVIEVNWEGPVDE